MSLSEHARALCAWVDAGLADKSPEAQLWHRVGKLTEEVGEVAQAVIGTTNGNPRKPRSHNLADVRSELLDVALCALAAHVHIAPHGDPLLALEQHAAAVCERAGLTV